MTRKKIVVISRCYRCPDASNCEKYTHCDIPDDCPLPDAGDGE